TTHTAGVNPAFLVMSDPSLRVGSCDEAAASGADLAHASALLQGRSDGHLSAALGTAAFEQGLPEDGGPDGGLSAASTDLQPGALAADPDRRLREWLTQGALPGPQPQAGCG